MILFWQNLYSGYRKEYLVCFGATSLTLYKTSVGQKPSCKKVWVHAECKRCQVIKHMTTMAICWDNSLQILARDLVDAARELPLDFPKQMTCMVVCWDNSPQIPSRDYEDAALVLPLVWQMHLSSMVVCWDNSHHISAGDHVECRRCPGPAHGLARPQDQHSCMLR